MKTAKFHLTVLGSLPFIMRQWATWTSVVKRSWSFQDFVHAHTHVYVDTHPYFSCLASLILILACIVLGWLSVASWIKLQNSIFLTLSYICIHTSRGKSVLFSVPFHLLPWPSNLISHSSSPRTSDPGWLPHCPSGKKKKVHFYPHAFSIYLCTPLKKEVFFPPLPF